MFVSEIYLYAAFMIQSTHSDKSLHDDTRQRIANSLIFLNDLRNALGYVPSVGDSDDARLFRWDLAPDTRLDGLLVLGSILLDFKLPKPRHHSVTAKLFDFRNIPSNEDSETLNNATEHGGWITISPSDNSPWGVLFIAAPLGLPPLHGHGHAHALSTIISLSGHPIVVDPGTFSYGENEWRDFFRSTRAHATVVVEDRDQAQPVDTFTWQYPYSCSWKIVQESDPIIIRAGHNGYKRLMQKVTHERIAQVSGTNVVIKDSLSSCTDLDFSASLVWPLHPSITVLRVDKGTMSLRIHERNCELVITGPGTSRIACGETTPAAGWYSPAFEERKPASTILVDAVGQTISWRTEFRLIE